MKTVLRALPVPPPPPPQPPPPPPRPYEVYEPPAPPAKPLGPPPIPRLLQLAANELGYTLEFFGGMWQGVRRFREVFGGGWNLATHTIFLQGGEVVLLVERGPMMPTTFTV